MLDPEYQCRKILESKGTQCRARRIYETDYCARHKNGSDGLGPNSAGPGRKAKTMKESVAAWDATFPPMMVDPPGTPEEPPAADVPALVATTEPHPTAPVEPVAPAPLAYYLEPIHMMFDVDLRTIEQWEQFIRTWKDRHPTLEMCTMDPADERDDDYEKHQFRFTIHLSEPTKK